MNPTEHSWELNVNHWNCQFLNGNDEHFVLSIWYCQGYFASIQKDIHYPSIFSWILNFLVIDLCNFIGPTNEHYFFSNNDNISFHFAFFTLSLNTETSMSCAQNWIVSQIIFHTRQHCCSEFCKSLSYRWYKCWPLFIWFIQMKKIKKKKTVEMGHLLRFM